MPSVPGAGRLGAERVADLGQRGRVVAVSAHSALAVGCCPVGDELEVLRVELVRLVALVAELVEVRGKAIANDLRVRRHRAVLTQDLRDGGGLVETTEALEGGPVALVVAGASHLELFREPLHHQRLLELHLAVDVLARLAVCSAIACIERAAALYNQALNLAVPPRARAAAHVLRADRRVRCDANSFQHLRARRVNVAADVGVDREADVELGCC